MFIVCVVFFFKQKTAYEMRISDWSSDVCSSDLPRPAADEARVILQVLAPDDSEHGVEVVIARRIQHHESVRGAIAVAGRDAKSAVPVAGAAWALVALRHVHAEIGGHGRIGRVLHRDLDRSEEHTSELQSLMRSWYAVFSLKKKTKFSRQ